MWRYALTAIIGLGLIEVGISVVILTMMAAGLWAGFIVVGLIRGETSKCPRCSSPWIRPSWRRRGVEKTLPRFICLHRCDNCRKRFFPANQPITRRMAVIGHPRGFEPAGQGSGRPLRRGRSRISCPPFCTSHLRHASPLFSLSANVSIPTSLDTQSRRKGLGHPC